MNDAPTAVAFRATIKLGGKTATGIEVPDDVVTALGSSRRPAVRATIAAALEGDAEAASEFEGLSYSHKRRHVLAIEDAKSDATRQRRIAKAVEMLRAGRA
jgi:uncharacterized protein YdeI (YjbR/CyaY-like superfamily)